MSTSALAVPPPRAATQLAPATVPRRRTGARTGAAAGYRSKRLLDLALGLVALTLVLPLLPLVALAIRLDSRGPALFVQRRVGQDGRIFRLYKFRTMYLGAAEQRAGLADRNEMVDGVLFKMRRDPRVTRVGHWLRRTSLDELPQLVNVVLGQMSLVGPRPALPEEVLEYAPEHLRRLEAKPGLTCHWQVLGRSELPFQEQMRLDGRYLSECSLLADLKLLLRTIPAVLSMRGAF